MAEPTTQPQTDAATAAEKKAAAAKNKAEAKQKLKDTLDLIKRLKEGPQTDQSKIDLEQLEKNLPDLYHAADESYYAGEGPKKAGDWFKNIFSNKDGKSFSISSIIGALVGAVGGYAAGGIFGEGMLGSILKIVLPLIGGIFGAQAAQSWFGGGDSNSSDGQQGRGAQARGQTLQLSLEGLEQMRAEARRRGASDAQFTIGTVGGKPALCTHQANQSTTVSYAVLKEYLSKNGGDKGEISVNIQAVLDATRAYGVAATAQTQRAAAAVNAAAAAETVRANAAGVSIFSESDFRGKTATAGANGTDGNWMRIVTDPKEGDVRLLPVPVTAEPTIEAAAARVNIPDTLKQFDVCRTLNQAECSLVVTPQTGGRATYEIARVR